MSPSLNDITHISSKFGVNRGKIESEIPETDFAYLNACNTCVRQALNKIFNTFRFRLVVFNGVRSFANLSTAGLEICALISCVGDSIDDCTSIYPNDVEIVHPTTFVSLMITRRSNITKHSLYSPTTLTTKLEPMIGSDFSYESKGFQNSTHQLMYLVRPRNDIMTFGIYGRRFDRDGDEKTVPDSADRISIPTISFLIMFAFFLRSL